VVAPPDQGLNSIWGSDPLSEHPTVSNT
jgi:hypothetical protein